METKPISHLMFTSYLQEGQLGVVLLVSSLSGFHAKFYDKINIKFITIFQRYLCSLCHIFPSSFLTSTGHAGNLPYANTMNKLQKM